MSDKEKDDLFGSRKVVIPNADNIRQLSDYKKMPTGENDSETNNISTRTGVIAWTCKYYSQLDYNGKFMIVNDRLPYKITFMGRSEFINSIEDLRLQITVTDPLGNLKITFEAFSKLFLESPSPLKKRYLDLAFFQREPFDPKTTYFMWRGIATKPVEGNCALTLAYIHNIISNKDEGLNKWIIDFLAHMVQKTFEKPEVTLLLIGLKGVGKTFFMDLVKVLVDGISRNYHVYKTSSSNDIFGEHKAEQMLHTLVLLLEEITWGGDVKNKGQMNDLITGHTQSINPKYRPHITVDNIMRVIMAANPGHVVPVTFDERRITGASVSSAHQQDHTYFAAIQNELDHGGYSALMHTLMTRDISKFNHREAYVTDALLDQIEQGMTPIEQWWLNVLRLGQINFVASKDLEDGSIYVPRKILWNQYKSDLK
jgi:hypothetical protein